MIFQEEAVNIHLINELKPLLIQHWEEIALNKDKIKLEPDYNKYIDLYKSGVLKCFTVREFGSLIGYYVVILMPHLHYSSHIFALNDIFYIHPKYRGKFGGIKFLKYVEKELKKLNVSVTTMHIKTEADFGPLLERIGYTCSEKTYIKYLGE